MKNTRFVRSLRALLMTCLCRWNDVVVHYACCTNELWLLDLAFAVQDYLERAWCGLYAGSTQELDDALDGRPIEHMSERQRAFFTVSMAQEDCPS